MTKVSMTTRVPVSAERLWQLVGQFNGLPDWHPGVEKSELQEGGKVRRLSLKGGGMIIERLERMEKDQYAYRYTMVSSPLPVADYVAELRVRQDEGGGGCIVEWSSEFSPRGTSAKEATEVIQGIYQAGFDHLKKLFGV
jgi:hypothetical protein